MRLGLSETWLCFGLISLVLTIVGWTGWPRDQAPRSGAEPLPDAGPKPRTSLALWVLCAEYALNAFGLVQHMVFLVDFIARGLGRGLETGGFYWTIFGLGAVAVVQLDPWSDPPELVAATPLGKVPALVTEDDTLITESTLISEYFDQGRARTETDRRRSP